MSKFHGEKFKQRIKMQAIRFGVLKEDKVDLWPSSTGVPSISIYRELGKTPSQQTQDRLLHMIGLPDLIDALKKSGMSTSWEEMNLAQLSYGLKKILLSKKLLAKKDLDDIRSNLGIPPSVSNSISPKNYDNNGELLSTKEADDIIQKSGYHFSDPESTLLKDVMDEDTAVIEYNSTGGKFMFNKSRIKTSSKKL